MSLYAISGGMLWEAPREQPQPKQDPERPLGRLRAVEGREADAARGAAMLSESHDEQAQRDAVRALIRAGIVEVVR